MPWDLAGNAGTTSADFLGTRDGEPLVIKTNNSEAMRIDPTGRIGVGTTTPYHTLQVGGGFDGSLGLDGSDGSPNAGYIRFGDTTGWKLHVTRQREFSAGPLNAGATGALMTIQDNGAVGIGTTAPDPNLKLDVAGRVGVQGLLNVADIEVGSANQPGSVFVAGAVTGESLSVIGQEGGVTSPFVSAGFIEASKGGIFNYSGAVDAFVVDADKIIGGIKQFRIDHPLDPENKYLTHACVESPDLKTFYDGIAELDGKGEAAVDLPNWFESLNKDFRYQLTCIGGSAAVYIAEEVKDNRFRIAGGAPRMRVSWQVTGVRRDPVAQASPVTVEENKPDDEKGTYQNPEAYGQAPEKGVRWMRGAERRRRREAVEGKRRRGEDQARSRG